MQVTQLFEKTKYWINFREECAAYIEQHLKEEVIPNALILTVPPPNRTELVYTLPKKEEHKPVYNVDVEFILEERASILWHDTGIAYEWAIAVVKLRNKTKPGNISIEGWNNIQQALSILCNDKCDALKTIIDWNWQLNDIFGCHSYVPERRYDLMGLLMLLNEGDKIVEVTSTTIKLQNERGKLQSYNRPFYNHHIERALIHELP